MNKTRWMRWGATALALAAGTAPSLWLGLPLASGSWVLWRRAVRIDRRNSEEVSRREQEQAAALIRQFEQVAQGRTEFLAQAAHELRTPLTSIVGFTDLLLRGVGGALTREQERFLRTVQSSGRHLVELANDLLDLSRLSTDRMQLQLEEVALEPLVEQVRGMFFPLLHRKAIRLNIAFDSALPVRGDPLRIRQILYNLISNAIKFTPHGGEIRVTVRAIRGPERPRVECIVTDNGVGIDAEALDRIFDEFRQEGIGGEGAGLGLTITKRLVELQGGQIWVHSRRGQGAAFGFSLPAAQVPGAAPGADAPEEPGQLVAAGPSGPDTVEPKASNTIAPKASSMVEPKASNKMGSPQTSALPILVRTEDPRLARLLERYLQEEGYRCETASGEKLARRAGEAFAVVVDVRLPEGPWASLDAVRGIGASAMLVSAVEGHELGCVLGGIEVLSLPIDPDHVARFLRQRGLLAALPRRPVNVLLLERTPGALQETAAILESHGLGLTHCHRWEEAVATAVELQPDLYLIDLSRMSSGRDRQMPLNPFELLRRLKEHPACPAGPVLLALPEAISETARASRTQAVRAALAHPNFLREEVRIELRKLERLAPERAGLLDPRTGLPTERFLLQRMHEELRRCGRLKRPLCLLQIGIDHYEDHFQKDREEGNRLLKEVADLLRAHTRIVNPVCHRTGGGFGILLIDTAPFATAFVAEKLRALVPGEIRRDRAKTPVTVSGGIAAFPENGRTPEVLLLRADEALAHARARGGNRIERAIGARNRAGTINGPEYDMPAGGHLPVSAPL